MGVYIGLFLIWGILFVLALIELRKKLRPLKSFAAITAINLLLCGLSIAVWFGYESDGFSQVFGAIGYGIFWAVVTLASAITLIIARYKAA